LSRECQRQVIACNEQSLVTRQQPPANKPHGYMTLISGFFYLVIVFRYYLSYIRLQTVFRSNLPVSEPLSTWTFLSNYAHVLVCLADNPDARLRDVAERVGITERTAFRLIGELEEAGVLERAKEGRRNHYDINTDAHLRHAIEKHCTVGELLETVLHQHASVNNKSEKLQ
jgi:predicted transcriptional regulator